MESREGAMVAYCVNSADQEWEPLDSSDAPESLESSSVDSESDSKSDGSSSDSEDHASPGEGVDNSGSAAFFAEDESEPCDAAAAGAAAATAASEPFRASRRAPSASASKSTMSFAPLPSGSFVGL